GDGPLQELILQNVTGYTGYQGLFTPYRPDSGHGTHALRLERVNVAYDPTLNRNSGAGKPRMLLFFGSAGDLRDQPPDRGTSLSGVYVDASYWNPSHLRAIYPQPKTLFGQCVALIPGTVSAGGYARARRPAATSHRKRWSAGPTTAPAYAAQHRAPPVPSPHPPAAEAKARLYELGLVIWIG
ncbi:MAG TPA: hypothetical protein VLR47_07635, partial [Rhodospirillales bacterium]|nr:hypothetical protein [Rhodospirillales bacterium]